MRVAVVSDRVVPAACLARCPGTCHRGAIVGQLGPLVAKCSGGVAATGVQPLCARGQEFVPRYLASSTRDHIVTAVMSQSECLAGGVVQVSLTDRRSAPVLEI